MTRRKMKMTRRKMKMTRTRRRRTTRKIELKFFSLDPYGEFPDP